MTVVVKIGTSSLTDENGSVLPAAIEAVVGDISAVIEQGHQVVLVTSGAIAAGLPALGFTSRPADQVTLQAASSVGQPMLYQLWERSFAIHDRLSSQILLAPHNFGARGQYLHARSTLMRLLELGVVPVVNENDAVTDEEIRYGDNDRIAALVAHMVDAETLVLLTDTQGLLTRDPRIDPEATLIEEIAAFDASLLELASDSGSVRGSGGMASKVVAARIAAWSGVRTVIASAERPDVVLDAVAGVESVGTTVLPRSTRVSARKLWIGFALEPVGRVVIDDGAVAALSRGGTSLLAAGIDSVTSGFERRDPVEIVDMEGVAVAKGLARLTSRDLAEGHKGVVVHTDDLVVLAV